ncbi:MAG: protein kinase [Turicibacter sp.]|nr:protein kinase [Turicibacter sp.]
MIIGTTVNERYEIKMLIGDGGMANVYLAYDLKEHLHVAIKSLRYELSKDERFIKRFKRESSQVIDMDHPNIVHVYSVEDDNDQPFMVMEYVQGHTLKDYLREKGALDVGDAIYIMRQLLEGVRYAHENKIIHRDLKTQNIMVTEELIVKVTDFGIALSSNEADMTQTNTIMGSVHYLAPELARGNLATNRSDIYALGIIFYELLTGTVPFKGEGAVNIALQHLEAPMPSILSLDETLPHGLDYIIKRATSKAPIERYASCEEFLADLDHLELDPEKLIAEQEEDIEEATMDLSPVVEEVTEMDARAKALRKYKVGALSYSIAAAYTAFILLAMLLYYLVVFSMVGDETAEVRIPDIRDLTVAEAEGILNETGINNVTIQYFPTTEHEVGAIIQTVPTIGTRIKADSQVTIRIAQQPGE